ncbi:hypothetical protein WMY93_006653 [Mugilogobius chulae]|uniref:Uncharacterized protein n=1 Tax=Mugilogobius chulae TaxID=88201 RepID=A0AAW0Q064_9GOBI
MALTVRERERERERAGLHISTQTHTPQHKCGHTLIVWSSSEDDDEKAAASSTRLVKDALLTEKFKCLNMNNNNNNNNNLCREVTQGKRSRGSVRLQTMTDVISFIRRKSITGA